MEIPIQVAVRIAAAPAQAAVTAAAAGVDNVKRDANGNINDIDETRCCVQAVPISSARLVDNSIAAGLIQVGAHSFPVTHALPANSTQCQLYHQAVFPLISLFMEGFDASVVTYGQSGTGKTYTLFGPGIDCVYSEADHGVVQRCVREIFAHMSNHAERTYAVNIGWVEICGENIRDLLGVGNVHCNSVTDVFHWLQLGMNTRDADLDGTIKNEVNEEDEVHNTAIQQAKHTLFTLTLEQRWVSNEGLIQHRLSTASFSDLCATERLFMLNSNDRPSSMPKDLGLQALEQVVCTLTDPALMYGVNGNIPYTQTTLTTLLKDSFGGRAQTLVIVCVSPLERDANETICNLQFAFKVQCVRNYVIMNTFSDDNTPFSTSEQLQPVDLQSNMNSSGRTTDHIGMQFAANQWFKLVSNAEGLFAKLMSTNAVSDIDKEQIEEWMFLKQECEECLSSTEAIRTQKQLVPIQETEEPEETLSEPDTSCQQNSDNESDSESQRPDLEEKLDTLMDELRIKTDNLVKDRYKEFLQKQPKAVTASQDQISNKNKSAVAPEEEEIEPQERKVSISGRRRSLQPGVSLSSAEIAMLNRVATTAAPATQTGVVAKNSLENHHHQHHQLELDDASCSDVQAQRAALNSPLETLQKKIRKFDAEIEAKQRQIAEVEHTMQLKQNIITELVKNSETRSHAKQRFNKKKAKLEADYEKTKKQLAKSLLQGKEKCEIERLHASITHLEQRLQDLTSMKHIAGESAQKVKKLQQSIHDSRKLVEELHKKLRKERKLRDQVMFELRELKQQYSNNQALVCKPDGGGVSTSDNSLTLAVGGNLRDMQARISHLDHVLREKSQNLEQYGNQADGTPEKEGLRHEIRNLRRTRDHLLEQRCSLDRKLKREKSLTQREERKLLECDEAIEAIDAAIEFKNELICGHRSIDTSDRLQREKGEQMLMARLNKLSEDEMRTLLYKYFTKVIDLRDSSRKLEVQLMQLERERDAWEWKERVLSNAVRQARLEGERNAVLLQRQHEMKLNLMLRHLADETSASSAASFSSYSDQSVITPAQRYLQALSPAALMANGTLDSSEFSAPLYKHKTSKAYKHNELEMCPLNTASDALTKYKPLDKLKEKERDTRNKLFAKFQVLTRYGGQSSSGVSMTEQTLDTAGGKKKDRDGNGLSVAIPQENLKRLISSTPATKVTRQKNKIIIQDASRKN